MKNSPRTALHVHTDICNMSGMNDGCISGGGKDFRKHVWYDDVIL